MSSTGPPKSEGFQPLCTREPQGASKRVFPLAESEINPTLAVK